MSASVIECGLCGSPAYVGRDGLHCYCTESLSAVEHHALDAFIQQRRDEHRRLRRLAGTYTHTTEEDAHP